MIPINDSEASRYSRWPVMTIALIVVNTLILILSEAVYYTDPLDWARLIRAFGWTPAYVYNQSGAGALTAITATFLHGGVFHLIDNMLFLWVFGRRVEDACGPWRFLCYYLICGVLGNVASAVVDPDYLRPGIGASGAIFGVMGAYLLIYPTGRIRSCCTLFFLPLFPRIRAFWIILYYFVSQLPFALDTAYRQVHY